MTSKELLKVADEITQITSPVSPLNTLLAALGKSYDNLTAATQKTVMAVLSGVGVSESAQALVRVIDAGGAETRRISLLRIFAETNKVRAVLGRFLSAGNSLGIEEFEHTRSLVDLFNSELEEYWRNHLTTAAHNLILTGARLRSELATLRTSAAIIKAGLAPATLQEKAGADILSLELPREQGLDEFGKKLSAVAALYSEFCELFQISEAQFPLQIVKVESGSLLLTILGSAAAVGGIRQAIIATVGYYHRNYTREGQIQQIPRNLEEAKSILQFANQLKAQGLDVTATLDQINKTTEMAATQLNTLLAGEEAVQIDGTPYPITTEAQDKLLRGRTILTLNESTPPAET